MNNPFKPYLHKITIYALNICIPAKFVKEIKNHQKFWYCKRCHNQVNSRNTEHCNDSLMRELEIFSIEKLGLHEINEMESRAISDFQNRMQLINFIEMHYGNIQCNEPLSVISIKSNP